jgi:hypothetical protein
MPATAPLGPIHRCSLARVSVRASHPRLPLRSRWDSRAPTSRRPLPRCEGGNESCFLPRAASLPIIFVFFSISHGLFASDVHYHNNAFIMLFHHLRLLRTPKSCIWCYYVVSLALITTTFAQLSIQELRLIIKWGYVDVGSPLS